MVIQSKSHETPVVLGIDPGFAAVGFAVVELAEPLNVLKLGVWRTNKKRMVKAADDSMRRGREVSAGIITHFIDPKISIAVICIEGVSLPRNASTSFKLGMCYGVIAALAEIHGFPVIQVSPQELKKAVCGNSTASKEEIAAALDVRFGRSFAPELVQHGFPAGVHEHAYDALGSVVAGMNSEVFRLVRRLVR